MSQVRILERAPGLGFGSSGWSTGYSSLLMTHADASPPRNAALACYCSRHQLLSLLLLGWGEGGRDGGGGAGGGSGGGERSHSISIVGRCNIP